MAAASAGSLFAGESHAAAYVKSRPKTPQALVDFVMKYLNQKLSPPYSLGVDVGCGSGQCTQVFAPHFKQLLGVDVSEAMIKEANNNETKPNVHYIVGSSSNIPVSDCNTQLVTAACSVHWFDLAEFYREVDRILVPGGVVALFGYDKPYFSEEHPELQTPLQEMYEILQDHWHDKCVVLNEGYKNIYDPYPGTLRDTISDDLNYTVEDLIGFIGTWSAYHTLLSIDKKKAEESLAHLKKRLTEALGRKERILPIALKYHIIMARKP